jgi:perosamine synthetase
VTAAPAAVRPTAGFETARGRRSAETIPHPPEWPVYEDAAIAAVADLLAHGRSFDYDYGDELAGFEAAFAAAHRRRHALALASGTAALLAAYSALGISAGDEVLVPAYTFFSTATPLFLLGAVPVLCDAGGENGNVSVETLEERITPRTAAIAVTHLWGHPCDMTSISEYARRRGLALLEDCSHAHGSTYAGRPVGSFGDVSVFSVGGRKLVSGGMGGVLLTDDGDLYSRSCLLANFRHRTDLTIPYSDYEPFLTTGLGGNFRMSPVAAVLAGSHLSALAQLVAWRDRNVTALVEAITQLPAGLSPVPTEAGCTVGARYDGVVAVDEGFDLTRDELARRLQDAGLKVREPATRPLHHYAIFRGAAPAWSAHVAAAVRAAARANDRPFPAADRLFDRWLRLPVNFLWDPDGAIVAPYVDACERLLDTDPGRRR